MLRVLGNPTYARLFAAQVVALLGTGLLTVALGLLAFELAGDAAGAVLGAAMTIKMVAYVGLAPLANAIAERLPRKAVLIGADAARAAVAICLPFVDAIWHVYALIFVLQSASATFTPAFQAIIPDVLEDEDDYTNALSLSRLAYDLENLISPTLAGLLLLVVSYHWLFAGTFIGFVGSAFLVWMAMIPSRRRTGVTRSFRDRLTRGTRIYMATPRLRGLLALNLAASAAGAFVIVNTVVVVRSVYGGSEIDVATALAAFGLGSMAAALVLPRLLALVTDRTVMLTAACTLTGLTLAQGLSGWMAGPMPWDVFLAAWILTGAFYSAVLTPSGRLLRRSAHSEDRPAVFAAQFALSHACWLIAYPLAGWSGAALGMPSALLLLGALGLTGSLIALRVWPRDDRNELDHVHNDLPPDHPHLLEHGQGRQHRHAFVIDDVHRVWPGLR